MDVPNQSLPLETIKNLSHERLNAYLTRKDAEHACEACGAIHWLVDHNEGQIMFTFAPLVQNIQTGLVLLPLCCGNCFNVRFMNAARLTRSIIDWEESNG